MFKNLSAAALGLSGTHNERIELALSYGFKGIDLDLVEFGQQVQTHGLAHARRMLDSSKLKIGTFRLPVAWQEDDETFKQDLEKLPRLAEIARSLNCLRAVTTISSYSETRPYHQNFEFHRRRFADLADALEPFGIRLGVELQSPGYLRQGKPFEFIHQPAALLMLLGMVGRRNIGVVLDLWHWQLAGAGTDAIRRLTLGQIVSVQAADAVPDVPPEQWREESRLLPGETGVIDTPAVLRVLSELGYDGPVTPTPHPNRFKNVRRDQAVKQAGEALDRVWTAAGLVGKKSEVGSRRSEVASRKSQA